LLFDVLGVLMQDFPNVSGKLNEVISKCEEEVLKLLILYFLDDKNLTEHGCSVNGSWISDKGKKMLVHLEKIAKYTRE